jgi:hypothetical protein
LIEESPGPVSKLCHAISIVFLLPGTIRARQGLPSLSEQLGAWTAQAVQGFLALADGWIWWIRGRRSALVNSLRKIGRPATHDRSNLVNAVLSSCSFVLVSVLVFSHIGRHDPGESGALPVGVQAILAVIAIGGVAFLSYRSLVVFIDLKRGRS